MRCLLVPTHLLVILATKHGVVELGIPYVKTWITFRTLDLQQVCQLCMFTVWLLTRLPFVVWISPVSQNYEGPRTPYGDAYHGYWIADASKLNDKFGFADDLKALSDELHRRDMYGYLMLNYFWISSTNSFLVCVMFTGTLWLMSSSIMSWH